MLCASKRSGKVSFILLAGICSVALVLTLFLYSDKSPRTVAAEFLTALANGNVDELAALSKINDKNLEDRKKDWAETIKYSRSFLFHWQLGGVRVDKDGKEASIRVDFVKNPPSPAAYPEKYELVLANTPEGWKVDVPLIPRDMYPYLPR